MLKRASKAPSSSVAGPPPSLGAVLAIGPYLHSAAGRSGDRTAQQEQVAPGHDLDHGQAALGDPPAAHAAGTPGALQHPPGGLAPGAGPRGVPPPPPRRRGPRMPLKTREGVAEAPIEPGARTLCEPW